MCFRCGADCVKKAFLASFLTDYLGEAFETLHEDSLLLCVHASFDDLDPPPGHRRARNNKECYIIYYPCFECESTENMFSYILMASLDEKAQSLEKTGLMKNGGGHSLQVYLLFHGHGFHFQLFRYSIILVVFCVPKLVLHAAEVIYTSSSTQGGSQRRTKEFISFDQCFIE